MAAGMGGRFFFAGLRLDGLRGDRVMMMAEMRWVIGFYDGMVGCRGEIFRWRVFSCAEVDCMDLGLGELRMSSSIRAILGNSQDDSIMSKV